MLNEILVGAIILVVIRALALPLAKSFARLWMSIYAAGVPSNLREDRRAEILSDLHEQVTDFREQGYRPDEIAFRIVLRVVRGMKDDVAWSAPYLPEALAEQFERGSEALRHIGTPKFITTAMAVVGMMNCAWLMSGWRQDLGSRGSFSTEKCSLFPFSWETSNTAGHVVLFSSLWVWPSSAYSPRFYTWYWIGAYTNRSPSIRPCSDSRLHWCHCSS